MGDLLLASTFPLVMRKAFGRGAGMTALAISLGVIGMLLVLPMLGVVSGTFPVVIVLGPLMVVQYAYWRRCGQERATWQYRLEEIACSAS